MSLEEDCGMCECGEHSGINEALFSSEVEALETHRQYHESLLIEAKVESSTSEAAENAVTSRMQEIQSKLERSRKKKKKKNCCCRC
ncbi:hypothetical protein L6164_011422 [Bauhinia variegata]|uniref:Uncharacterized protein n=1 Tax=Bauhinia variegata TaxID=167791 RepID=A0ACB9P5V0_BAUVA|nr:hypothetical protein L6164_011422 [Bauhinia variegata]